MLRASFRGSIRWRRWRRRPKVGKRRGVPTSHPARLFILSTQHINLFYNLQVFIDVGLLLMPLLLSANNIPLWTFTLWRVATLCLFLLVSLAKSTLSSDHVSTNSSQRQRRFIHSLLLISCRLILPLSRSPAFRLINAHVPGIEI